MNLPNFAPLRVTQRPGRLTRTGIDSLDHLVIIVPEQPQDWPSGLPLRAQIERLAKRAAQHPDKYISTRLDNARATQLIISTDKNASTAFERLSRARKLIAIAANDGGSLGILVFGIQDPEHSKLTDALLSAASAASFFLPNYKSTPAKKRLTSVLLLGGDKRIDLAEVSAASRANNIARWFAVQPPNELDATSYREAIETLSKQDNLQFNFIDEKELRQLGAGAFLAVSQGNKDRDAGIAHIRYEPKNFQAHLALVGKGVIYDTGGNNLKSFRGMLDMHMDMQGSSVALGVLLALAQLQVPYRIDAWLAITENRLSAAAYKAQDVVKSVNGTTIQVIHTDAEGRMVLADTLALAAREKPNLIIDYATLTGACVTALGNSYSGVFSNRTSAHADLVAAGNASGERVWSFPFDSDFDTGLESEIADIKQCNEDSAADHILAARFLNRFVPKSIPWVHVDLSASQHKGGLAHVASECTGFGTRFSIELLERQLDFRQNHNRLFTS